MLNISLVKCSLATFTKEFVNGKLHVLCSASFAEAYSGTSQACSEYTL